MSTQLQSIKSLLCLSCLRPLTRFAVIAVSFLSALLTFSCDRDQSIRDRQVSVTGSCIRRVAPDRAEVTVTSVQQSMEVQAAIKKATREYQRLQDQVKAKELKGLVLQTSEYNVRELREWENEKMVPKGYQARIGLSVVTSDIEKIGEVLEIAARLGIQEVGGLRTFLSDEAALKEREACLADAIRNALSKAEAMATASGDKVGELLNASEGTAATDMPAPPMHRAEMAIADSAEGSAPAIEAAEEKISVQVQATFKLR